MAVGIGSQASGYSNGNLCSACGPHVANGARASWHLGAAPRWLSESSMSSFIHVEVQEVLGLLGAI